MDEQRFEVAAVDRIPARSWARAGQRQITATADDISARTRLTVLPRPGPLGGPAPRRYRTGGDWIASWLEECYDAVRSRNLFRLRAVWQPRTRADQENFKRLTRILGTSSWSPSVGDRMPARR